MERSDCVLMRILVKKSCVWISGVWEEEGSAGQGAMTIDFGLPHLIVPPAGAPH